MLALLLFTLVMAVVFGGANRQGGVGDAIVILAATPLLTVAVYRLLNSPRPPWGLLVLAGLTMLLPWLQTVNWPGSFIPGADARHAFGFDHARVFGIEVHQAWSFAPDATSRTMLSFVPPLAVLLGVMALPPGRDRWVLATIAILVVLSAAWALAQLAFSGQVDLTFHVDRPSAQATGFFSNRNHFAALMYLGLALAGFGVAADLRRMLTEPEGSRHAPRVTGWAIVLAFALIGLAAAQSRAGVVLGAGVLLLVLVFTVLAFRGATRGFRRGLGLIGVAAMLIAIHGGVFAAFERFRADPIDERRVEMQRNSLAVASELWPYGSGFGTFSRVYEQREPAGEIANTFVNRAHNDWIEIVIEAGVFAIALALGWILWWIRRLARVPPRCREGGSVIEARLLRGACIVGVVAIALHSMVDSPMRTIAIATLVAALVGLAAGWRPMGSSSSGSISGASG